MQVNIKPEVYQKVMFWVNKTDIEVSGFGLVEFDKKTATFNVVDAFLLEQEGGAAHTDIDGVALSKLMYQAHKYQQETGKEYALKWWWHSHVKMGVFWSGTDTSTIKELGQQGWIVATVFNQKNEYKSAVCWKTTSELGTSLSINEDVKTSTIQAPSEDLIKKWTKEFDDNVKEKKVISYNHYNHRNYKVPDSDTYQWDKDDYYNAANWDLDHYKTKVNQKPDISKLSNKEIKKLKREYGENGYFGYGLDREAKILNISPRTYLEKLINGTELELEEIERKLLFEEQSGVLRQEALDAASRFVGGKNAAKP